MTKVKSKTVFVCSECGNEYTAWQGQCAYCGAWNTIKEYKIDTPKTGLSAKRHAEGIATPVRLSEVGAKGNSRIPSGIGEFDRVLGGGFVYGSLVLISGEPGIGKSTMIIQSANLIAASAGNVLYASGEESEEQIRLRADRVCAGGISDRLHIFSETCLDDIISACRELQPKFLVIDSIQTMYASDAPSAAGSIAQIRACSDMLMRLAKSSGIPVLIVAHINKSGDLAGPKTVEHMVDCVLSITGERDRDLRILRAYKNRFGTTDEIGAFRMDADGMREEKDISGSLLENPDIREEGSVVSAIYEGSRPVFFEIQALVTPSNIGFPRRTSVGIDQNRLSMILAVLEKKAGLSLLSYDVYVNVVGGMKPDSPATDLAVALAIYSSYRERTSPHRLVAIGEVGLTGKLRSVRNASKIAAEAGRLGYDSIILPKKNAAAGDIGKTVDVLGADNISEAIKYFG